MAVEDSRSALAGRHDRPNGAIGTITGERTMAATDCMSLVTMQTTFWIISQ
jgi:hypothetical protein